tara:strand:- start:104 stop:415 length:312 start_codon:yes stop_codon:yes gene_type:complete
MTSHHYRVPGRAEALDVLRPHGLAVDDAFRSRRWLTVDWLGQTYDPPAQYDDAGTEIEPGVDQGLLLNLYPAEGSARVDAVIADCDAAFERLTPGTPLRDIAL